MGSSSNTPVRRRTLASLRARPGNCGKSGVFDEEEACLSWKAIVGWRYPTDMGTESVQWPEVVSAVSSSLGVVITAILTAVIYRLGKRDTAKQRREEREFSRRMKAYEAVGR